MPKIQDHAQGDARRRRFWVTVKLMIGDGETHNGCGEQWQVKTHDPSPFPTVTPHTSFTINRNQERCGDPVRRFSNDWTQIVRTRVRLYIDSKRKTPTTLTVQERTDILDAGQG